MPGRYPGEQTGRRAGDAAKFYGEAGPQPEQFLRIAPDDRPMHPRWGLAFLFTLFRRILPPLPGG
jgi:hypothetical protein